MQSDLAFSVDILKAIRAHFGDDNQDVVIALIPLAPNAGVYSTSLTIAAYRRGLIAGLSVDSLEKYPKCPYDRNGRRLSNFASGKNDPQQAWRAGSRDGIRISDIVLRPRLIVPALTWREYKCLPAETKAAFDSLDNSLARV